MSRWLEGRSWLGWVGLVRTIDSSETVGTITEQFERLIHMKFEQWKKNGLFMVYRGLYYPIICGLINHYKDPYETNQLLLLVLFRWLLNDVDPTVPLNILTKTSQKHEELLRRLIFTTCGSFKSKHCKESEKIKKLHVYDSWRETRFQPSRFPIASLKKNKSRYLGRNPGGFCLN